MQYAEANPRIRPYISIRLKALLQRVRNRLKDVLIYLHSPKWLTQKRGYIYATAAAGVGGGFDPDSRHDASHAPCHATACHAMPLCWWVTPCPCIRCCYAAMLPINVAACVSREETSLLAHATGWLGYHNTSLQHRIRCTSLSATLSLADGWGHIGDRALWAILGAIGGFTIRGK